MVSLSNDRGAGRVSVEALDERGSFRNFLALQGTIIPPKGEKQIVSLPQTGPGHYEAGFVMREPGAYVVAVSELQNGQVRATEVVGESLNYSPEFDAAGPNLGLLRRLAESTGDPGLDTVLAEIELRVEVELAKIGMPRSGAQGNV